MSLFLWGLTILGCITLCLIGLIFAKLPGFMGKFTEEFSRKQLEGFKLLQDSQQKGTQESRQQIRDFLDQHAQHTTRQLQLVTQTIDQRLKEITGQVDKRLSEGFKNTTDTFSDIVKRLALIDKAQQEITKLSSNVVSLQEILNDKRSRGAFGEVQLAGLIRNIMPESAFSLQHTLSNGKRPDCLLFLPDPTGNVAIDAKFPLESYQKLAQVGLSEIEKNSLKQQFKQDIKHHIQAIAEKYILPGETSDGAVMFIPAEAIFAEIHAFYPELIELAHKKRVWLVSPTTMMAVLTTARAVLKDADTRKHVHIIQEHLSVLAVDFERFQKRMDNLAVHIAQANKDVELVNTSAKKISGRFHKIEKMEIETEALSLLSEEFSDE